MRLVIVPYSRSLGKFQCFIAVLGQTPKRVLRGRVIPFLEGEGAGLDPVVCLQNLEVFLGALYCCWRQTPAE